MLLNIIGILDEKDSGNYEINGMAIENLTESKTAEYRSHLLGFVFQSFNLINYKNALQYSAVDKFYSGEVRYKEFSGQYKFVGTTPDQ